MGASDVKNVAEILETVFDVADQSMLYEAAPLIGLMPKDEKFGGKERAVTLRYSPEPGGSADFDRAKANKNPSKYKQFKIERATDYVLSSISHELYLATKGTKDGALVDAVTSIVTGMRNTAKRSLCKAMYGNGGGSRGVVQSGVGSNTLQLTNRRNVS